MGRLHSIAVFVGLVASTAWVGCGGGGGGNGLGTVGGADACGVVQPCGGDPTGVWKLSDVCVNSMTAANEIECAGATTKLSGVSIGGTVTLNADLSYSTTNVTFTATVHDDIPASCLPGITCAELQAELQLTGETVTCSGGSSCDCAETVSSSSGTVGAAVGATTNDVGTYTFSGGTLTLTSDVDGSQSALPYCVQNGELHLIDLDATMQTAMGTAVVDQDIVAHQ